jgi:hypothetical protein
LIRLLQQFNCQELNHHIHTDSLVTTARSAGTMISD